jgi:transcriptional regulator with XRE-family HTH domain
LIEFGQQRFGKDRGWKAAFARELGLTPGGLELYTSGKQTPGNVLQSRLRGLDCDIEWLFTGESKRQERTEETELIDLLRQHGIRTTEQLLERLRENERLKRSLGVEAYSTLLEVAAVREKQTKYRRKRK